MGLECLGETCKGCITKGMLFYESRPGLVYKLGPVSAALLLPTGMRHLAVAYDIETLTAGMSYSNNQHYDYKILIILRNLPDGPHQVYE